MGYETIGLLHRLPDCAGDDECCRCDVKDVVVGVAELNGVIYTVCQGSESIQTFQKEDPRRQRRNLPVEGLRDVCDVVASICTFRLYVADQHGFMIISPSSHSAKVRLSAVLRVGSRATSFRQPLSVSVCLCVCNFDV